MFYIGLIFTLWLITGLVLQKTTIQILQRLRSRFLSVLGFGIVGGSMFYLTWIQFDFFGYVDPVPENVRTFVTTDTITIGLLNWLHFNKAASWIESMIKMTGLNAFSLQLVPSLSLTTRLGLLLPLPFTFLCALRVVTVGLFNVRFSTRLLPVTVISLSTIFAMWLLWLIPDLAILDLAENGQWRIIIALLGAQIGWGPYFAAFGLLLIGLGEIVALTHKTDQAELSDIDVDLGNY